MRAGRLFVDTKRAILYRKSRSPWARAGTYVAPLLWTALGAIVVLLPHWLELGLVDASEFWSTWRTPLGAYALVLAGAAAHILVAAQKERAAASGAPLPVGSPLDWLHTRWSSIGLTFVWAVVVVFGIALTEMTGANASQLNREAGALFVFAGFSVDSVAGLFLSRFDVLATKGMASLRERISA